MPSPKPPTSRPLGPRATAVVLALDRGIYWFARHWLVSFQVLLVLWLGAAILAPILQAAGQERPASVIYAMFRPFCQQRPDRSLHLFGEKMACCERCFAIYSVLALFGLAYFAFRGIRPLAWSKLAFLALPILADVATQTLGLRESTTGLRLATGGLFAIGVAWLALPHFEQGFADIRQPLERRFARLVAEGRAHPLRGAPAMSRD